MPAAACPEPWHRFRHAGDRAAEGNGIVLLTAGSNAGVGRRPPRPAHALATLRPVGRAVLSPMSRALARSCEVAHLSEAGLDVSKSLAVERCPPAADRCRIAALCISCGGEPASSVMPFHQPVPTVPGPVRENASYGNQPANRPLFAKHDCRFPLVVSGIPSDVSASSHVVWSADSRRGSRVRPWNRSSAPNSGVPGGSSAPVFEPRRGVQAPRAPAKSTAVAQVVSRVSAA